MDWYFGAQAGRGAFRLDSGGSVLSIVRNFFPVGWPQLAAADGYGYACARGQDFHDATPRWQWLRMPENIVFAPGAPLKALDFHVTLRPLTRRAPVTPADGMSTLPQPVREKAR